MTAYKSQNHVQNQVFRILGLALFAILMATGANARGASCYKPIEAEAEQGIKIHSELMVIGLNCMHKSKPGEPNLYAQYRNFTSENAEIFQGYEQILLNHYEREHVKDPDAALKQLRTSFANQISSEAAGMRPDVFCYHYAPRIEKAAKLDAGQLREWASMVFSSHPTSKPICNP